MRSAVRRTATLPPPAVRWNAACSSPALLSREPRLRDVANERLARLADARIVGPAVGDVVRENADAEERHAEQSGHLCGRRRFHLFRRRAELVVKACDAIELAVPD